MELLDAIENTRTYHKYNKTSVDENFVNSMIEVSLKAPNHKYTFPWKYIWLKGKTKEKIANIVLDGKREKLDPELGRDEEFFKSIILNPECLFVVQKLSDSEFTRKEDYATLSCSIQLMALYLRENGMGYKWSTGGFTRDPKTYETLGVDSSKEEIIGLIMFGNSDNTPIERRRPDVFEVLISTT